MSSKFGLDIQYESYGSQQKVIIEAEPKGETPAEPVYPDPLEIYIEPPDLSKLPPADINEDLSKEKEGESFSISFDRLAELGYDINKLAFDLEEYRRRMAVFDTKEYIDQTKLPTEGKPKNNNDPYPFDEKIEELETHAPMLKIHKMELDDPDPSVVTLAQYVMAMSDMTEKRLVKLENILATVLRNLARIGSRVFINCVYYGGQDNYRKYNCIRCLHDDRIRDGQSVTIDQCLNCTRYEPIIGQVYDILDQTGANIANILDDNQMSYSTMEDYVKFTRTEEMPEEEERLLLDGENVTQRDPDEKDFADTWDEGFKMDWSLVPVEEQKPDVHYEDGSESKILPSSYQDMGSSYDAILSGGAGGYYTLLEGSQDIYSQIMKNEEAFQACTDQELLRYIKNGRQFAKGQVEKTLKNMEKYGYEPIIQEEAAKAGIDPLLVLAVIAVESGGEVTPGNDATTRYNGLMQVDKKSLSSGYASKPVLEKARENIQVGIRYIQQKFSTCWNTKNVVVGMIAYNSGEGMVLGVSSKGVSPIYSPGLNKDAHNEWLWTDIAHNLKRNVNQFYGAKYIFEKLTYYPRIHYVYMNLVEKKGFSPFDGKNLKFPFYPQDVKKIYFTSDFGMRFHPIKRVYAGHMGVDLAGPLGTPVLAAASGVVETIAYQPGGAGQYVCIDHGNNFYTIYMHLIKNSPQELGLKVGQKVPAGAQIGRLGNTGGSTGPHLHFEIREGGRQRSFAVDPKKFFPFLKGKLNKSLGS